MQVQNVERPYVYVSELLTDKASGLNLQVIAGKEGLANRIHFPKIQKPGLALTGFTQYVRSGRVQIFGESELAFLKTLDQNRREEVLRQLYSIDIACSIVCRGQQPPPEMIRESEAHRIPLMVTPHVTSDTIEKNYRVSF